MAFWRVNKTTIGDWEVGYCRIDGQDWMRVWIRRDGISWHCHVLANGNITFETGIGREGAPREIYEALFAAIDEAPEHDPGLTSRSSGRGEERDHGT